MKHTNVDGFSVVSDDEKFVAIFSRIREILNLREGKVLGDRMDEPKRKRLILLTEIDGVPVVIKRELFIFRFDRSLKAFLFGSDAKNIFKITQRARERGFTKIPRTFLVAEKFSGGILRETISVTEFLDGNSLQLPLTSEQQNDVHNLLAECHAHGIISGDVHPGNFIVTNNGLKLIDFRGNKVFPALSKARDRIQAEHNLGVKDDNPTFSEKVFFFLNHLRNIGRKLRGEPIHLD